MLSECNHQRPKVADGIGLSFIGLHARILESKAGTISLLNPTASAVMALADGEMNVTQLANEVMRLFSTSEPQLEQPVINLIWSLVDAHLLVCE